MKTIINIFTFTLLMFASLAYAEVGGIMQVPTNGITIYTEPTASAKAVATLAAGQQLIPVYQQKNWVKVANPANGDIGWVKQADLQQAASAKSQQAMMQNVVITQQNGADKKVYQIDANGNIQVLKGTQADAVIKKMTEQQQQMQDQFNKMMSNAWQNYLITQDVFKKFNQQVDWQMSNMMPPIIVINKTDGNVKQDNTKSQPASNKATHDNK
jgi:hypothetical protein